MSVFNTKFLKYLWSTLYNSHSESTPAFLNDRIFALSLHCIKGTNPSFNMDDSYSFNEKELDSAIIGYKRFGLVGVISSYFHRSLLHSCIDDEGERMVICLKRGFMHMPATTTAIIMKGFDYQLSDEDVRLIYSSYGLSQGMRALRDVYDWVGINRRVIWLEGLFGKDTNCQSISTIQIRFYAMCSYLNAERKKKESAIKVSGLNRSLFFYYWKRFKQYGILGLMDKGKESFRSSKVGLENEAKVVIDKLQHPERSERFYLNQLQTKGITVDRSCIAKIVSRWKVKEYHSEYVSNLERLENEIEGESRDYDVIPVTDIHHEKLADKNFMSMFEGMGDHGLFVSAPGIFALWAYLEELGIFKVLSSMGLTKTGKGYTWFDFLLLDVARRFYGIETHSRMCIHEEPSLTFFAHLLSLPCNDSFLIGLGRISEGQIFSLRKWLIQRNKQLGLLGGKKIAFDFHQIDLDVIMGILRKIGKGSSPKKKICYNGFRPHIAWDIDSGNLIVAEYRKGSARGTTTMKRFVKDFILTAFKELFDTIYIDSEYTGQDTWSFIMDPDSGMGAELTACLKQNKLVKKYRDQFLLKQSNDQNFWSYYDDDHVYSSKTFTLEWNYTDKNSGRTTQLALYCVVKKILKTVAIDVLAPQKKMFPHE